ncbi:hypothetical protein NCER_100764 [Vairimorpha ceranae BRL01]|uniref:Uncharacterized protein n=1 Tax=Vairimorpha ceranae (strain BRL01) TaxID=578460 RepID=C4V8E9_VAIC1|nr:hypothetical protein NCER_100764 [Vairimorpha ceranae BRL01]
MQNTRKKILKKIKGTKKPIFDEEIIPEDPFDIFYKNSPLSLEDVTLSELDSSFIDEADTTKIISKPSQKDGESYNHITSPLNKPTQKISEDDFLSVLSKPKSVNSHKSFITPKIINQLILYTSDDIVQEAVPMYKFPYMPDLRFEKSNIFKSIYTLFISSLLNIFKSKKDFIMKYKSDILIYKNKELKVSKGLIKLLNSNDIKYEENDFLILKNIDIDLMIDLILNEPLSSTYVIPFIISRHKFINGMYYEVNLKKDKVAVKKNNQVLYKYILDGPFLNQDFIHFLSYDNDTN